MAEMRSNRARMALFLTAACTALVLALAALGLAQSSASNAESLRAPLPQPTQVFIQRTGAFPDIGNVLVTVRLAPEDLARKDADGTRDFVAFGGGDEIVILRDDGQGGDAASRDGVFTGIGTVDDAALEARAAADKDALASGGNKQSLIFMGRTSVGVDSPRAFDLAGFQAGKAVPFDPAVAFIEPERAETTSSTAPTASPSGLRSVSMASLTNVSAAGTAPVVLGTNLFQERVLMIRNLAVVKDPARTWDPCTGAGNPNGVWTFNHLMTEMANQAASGIDPGAFVHNWANQFLANPAINGHNVPPRNGMANVLNNWPKRPDGEIDLARSPFRLLAIDPRVDLRRTTGGGGGYGGGNLNGNFLDGGEMRFIFGLVNTVGGCSTQRFAVIFEYRVPRCECEQVKAWAASWVKLFGLVPGSAAYNGLLEVLTEQIVKANANPTKPNGSALGQLRTNELAIGGPFWELREFQLTQFPFSFLNETTSADTAIDTAPPQNFNNTAVFDNWVLGKISPNLTAGAMFQNPVPQVPLFFGGFNFLGSNPQTPNTNFFWRLTAAQVPALSPNGGNNTTNWGRHRASLASCNGCHGRESRPAVTVAPFVHVDPSSPLGAPATLSEFLTGINNLADPQEPAGLPLRNFDDLARRELDIQRVAKMTCFGFTPVNVAAVQDSLRTSGVLPADPFAGVPADRRVPLGVDDFRRNVVTEVH